MPHRRPQRAEGDYHIVRYGGPVAVCTLPSDYLADRLARREPGGLAIVGTLHTENLEIERVILNALANPRLRFLVLCGEDMRRASCMLTRERYVQDRAPGEKPLGDDTPTCGCLPDRDAACSDGRQNNCALPNGANTGAPE